MKHKGIMKTVAAVFSLSIVTCLLPADVHADETGFTKTADNTSIGTSGIGAPSSSTGLTSWTGNYVYYGKYDGNPIKYRVLDPDSTDYKDDSNHDVALKTMLVDCDSVLTTGTFGSKASGTDWGSNACAVRVWMNGTFLSGFSSVEKAAVPAVYKSYSSNISGNYYVINLTHNEKVFALDMFDVQTPAYGYTSKETFVDKGSDYWLRTRNNNDKYINTHAAIALSTSNSGFSTQDVTTNHGYSPAFNVLLDSIIFSTKVNSNATAYGNVYKLTLKDDGFGIAVTEGSSLSIDGTTVTVPYTVTDNDTTLDPDTVSVLIKDANDGIKYYAPLTGTYAATGTGTFELPSDLTLKDWGTEYTVSILAEDVNGQHETDYASEPVEVAAPFVDMGLGEHLAGYSISLNGDIGVNFYMELDSTIVNSDTAYMEFSLPNGETPKVYVKDVRSNPDSVDGKTYYVFKCNVAAKEMTAPITAQMKDGDKTGSPYSYTVRDYADYLLKHTEVPAYSNAADLVKAMLNYGACAQTYFNYNPNDLANKNLADNDRFENWNVTSIDNIDNAINAPYDEDGTTLPTGVTFEGATLSLKSETSLSLYFKGLPANTQFSCTGNMVEKKVETNTNGAYVIARIRGIKAEELKNDFTVTIKDSNSLSVTYSPMTYCYNVVNSTATSNELKNVCRMFYEYASAASSN